MISGFVVTIYCTTPAGQEDASPYYAISPFFMLPVSALLPLGMGFFLDRLSFLKAGSYRAGFLILAGIVLVSFLPLILLRLCEN
jgi:hypothetical protein